MTLDFLEDHKEKITWYFILLSGGFFFGFVTNYILLDATLNYSLLQGFIWGASAVFFTFLAILSWKHLK